MSLLVEPNGHPAPKKGAINIDKKKDEETIRQVTIHLLILEQAAPQYKGQLKLLAILFLN